MTDLPEAGSRAGGRRETGRAGLLQRLAGSRRFQSWAARVPGLRGIARAEGAAIFDLVAGFVKSQALMALVETGVMAELARGPRRAGDLARAARLDPEAMALLLRAGAGMGLLRQRRGGEHALTMRGAAMMAVPGLPAMIRHHRVLYADLADPVAFLRGETAPALAGFWPYVFGAARAEDPEVASAYSGLMADSQMLVAEDTLRLADLSGVRCLMDVGGGTGTFLAAAARAWPSLALVLFDLPAVVAGAPARLADLGAGGRVTVVPGSFRDDPLPAGADAISLVRVLYDHRDETVAALLRKAFAALPPGGLLLVSEPMSGGDRPDPVTDTYFAFYCRAMGTGRVRSAAEIASLISAAGFAGVTLRPGRRPYVTSVVMARRPA